MELDEDELEMFVDTLFDVISASGAKSVPQIMAFLRRKEFHISL